MLEICQAAIIWLSLAATIMKTTFNLNSNTYLLFAATLILMAGAFVAAAPAADAQYYGGMPTYNYGSNYSYTYPDYGQLRVSCYSMPQTAKLGQSVTWYASAYGGNNSYNYTWSGDEGLSGYGQSIGKVYSYSGFKNASVTVISGGQSISQNCDDSVKILASYYSNPPITNYPPVYYPPTYIPPASYYSPITVSCSPNASSASVGQGITWTAYATGGNGYFTYNWTGTDGLYGIGQSTYFTYANPGSKIASVTVYSGGQSVTQSCANYVTVGYPYTGYSYPTIYNAYQTPAYQTPAYQTYPVAYATSNYSGLDIGCYSDPTNAKANQPVTWTAEVTGGVQPYSYSWTGSDGLSGSQASVIKYYSASGSKSAIVTVTSADGKSATHACSNALTIGNAYRAPVAAAKAPVQQAYAQPTPEAQAPHAQANEYPQTAALFSLANVPWGWIAILVILMLFFTVLYLLINRQKI